MEIVKQVQLAQQGDEAAFAELYLRFEPVVRCYANRSHVKVCRDDAIGAGQLAVVQAIKSYDPVTGVPLGAYIEQRVKYAVWNLFKQERKVWQHTVSYDVSQLTDEDGPDCWRDTFADDDAERNRAAAEFKLDFRRIMPDFSSRQQQVLQALIAGFTQTEISRRLNVSPQAVYKIKIRLRQGLKKLGFGMEEDVGR